MICGALDFYLPRTVVPNLFTQWARWVMPGPFMGWIWPAGSNWHTGWVHLGAAQVRSGHVRWGGWSGPVQSEYEGRGQGAGQPNLAAQGQIQPCSNGPGQGWIWLHRVLSLSCYQISQSEGDSPEARCHDPMAGFARLRTPDLEERLHENQTLNTDILQGTRLTKIKCIQHLTCIKLTQIAKPVVIHSSVTLPF